MHMNCARKCSFQAVKRIAYASQETGLRNQGRIQTDNFGRRKGTQNRENYFFFWKIGKNRVLGDNSPENNCYPNPSACPKSPPW